MNVIDLMIILLAIYLGVGLFLAYRFMTKELPEIFDEELDEKEDEDIIKARDQLYDVFHNLDKLIGRKGVTISIFIGGMLFWLPMWIHTRLST